MPHISRYTEKSPSNFACQNFPPCAHWYRRISPFPKTKKAFPGCIGPVLFASNPHFPSLGEKIGRVFWSQEKFRNLCCIEAHTFCIRNCLEKKAHKILYLDLISKFLRLGQGHYPFSPASNLIIRFRLVIIIIISYSSSFSRFPPEQFKLKEVKNCRGFTRMSTPKFA